MSRGYGPCAVSTREPRQARKGATVSGVRQAPQVACIPLRKVAFFRRPPRRSTAVHPSLGRPGVNMNQAYVPLPLKWRPRVFSEIIGQNHVVRVLTATLERDRLAHAYLFSGPKGSGKTSTARILAKTLNCTRGPTVTPCLECAPCREIAAGRSPDVLEIDGASNRGINEIRNLQELLRFRPMGGRYKIVIIDEVHMLTTEAFNALLKTLEEPPAHVVFILATTEPRKVPLTILSRCHHLEFHRISEDEIYRRLVQVAEAEALPADPEALRILARSSEGSLRDALSLLEQAAIYAGGKITAEHVADVLGLVRPGRLLDLIRHLAAGDTAATLAEFHRLIQEGYDVKTLVDEVLMFFRTALWSRLRPDHPVALVQDDAARALFETLGEQLREEDLLHIAHLLLECSEKLRLAEHPVIQAELTLARICRLPDLMALEEVIDRNLQNPAWSWQPEAPATPAEAPKGRLGDRPTPAPPLLASVPKEVRDTPPLPEPDPLTAFLQWLKRQPGWRKPLETLKDVRHDEEHGTIVLTASPAFADILRHTLLETGEMAKIHEALRKYFKKPVTLTVETTAEPAPAEPASPTTTAGFHDPDVERYREALQGRLLSVEVEPGEPEAPPSDPGDGEPEP